MTSDGDDAAPTRGIGWAAESAERYWVPVELLTLGGVKRSGLAAGRMRPLGIVRPGGHQPRARHSGICGRSAPSVLSFPWPG